MSERMPDEAGFDPRYSPVFQPGYDPDVHGDMPDVPSTPRGSRPQIEPDAVSAHELAADDGADRGADDVDENPAIDLGFEQPNDPLSNAERRVDRPALLRNPFTWIIAVIGVVLIAWGNSAIRTATELSYSETLQNASGAPIDYAEIQISMTLGSLAVVCGILTLVGLVFFAAFVWRPRRRPQAAERE